jgi:hypothetical protein
MSLLSLAFYPVQGVRTIPKATVGEAFANPFPANFDNVSHIEDSMLLSARISHRAFLDVEVTVFFNSHCSKPLKCSFARPYLIHSMRVEYHSIGDRSVG